MTALAHIAAPERPAVLPEAAAHAQGVEAVVLAAFGPGRYAKTAERLREAREPSAGFVALDGDEVAGSVRIWPIRIGDAPALFLGPIAVADHVRRDGVGADLVEACLAWADASGQGVLLVGDEPYFGRFGFTRASGVDLGGPVDSRRLLWRGAATPTGSVRPG